MASKRKREKQSRLSFTPLPSSSPASKGYDPQIRARAAAVTLDSSPSRKRPLRFGLNADLPTPVASSNTITNRSDSEEEDSLPVRGNSTRSYKRQKVLDFNHARDPSTFDDTIRLVPSGLPSSSAAQSLFSSQRRARRTLDSSSDEADDDLEDEIVVKQLEKPAIVDRSRDHGQEVGVEDDDDDDDDIRSSMRTPGGQPRLSAQRRVDDNTDDTLSTPRTRHKNRRGEPAKRARRNISPTSSESSQPSEQPDRRNVRLHRKTIRRSTDAEESDAINVDEDEEEPVTPPRQRGKRRRVTQEEQAELEEDLEFLQPSSDAEEVPRQPRNTQSIQKNARLQALEQLKRKRAGGPEIIETERAVITIDDDDGDASGGAESLDIISDKSSDDDNPPPVSSRQFFQETKEDEDFVIDDDGSLGVPTDIPIEFTKYASMKAKDLFGYVVEWMVQKKINPAFQQNDDIYRLAFKKINDEITGLAGSKFKSSAWTPQFTKSLEARPNIEYVLLRDLGNPVEQDKCEACNRSGHPATYSVKFFGTPYHPETLDDVPNGSDDDSDGSDSSAEAANDRDNNVDVQGRAIAPAGTEYLLGRTCMANASTAHAFLHWRHALYNWVIEWLDRNGHNSPEKVLRRDQMSTRKRGKQANKIIDGMVRDGAVKEIYRDFKENINEARMAKENGRFDGGVD